MDKACPSNCDIHRFEIQNGDIHTRTMVYFVQRFEQLVSQWFLALYGMSTRCNLASNLSRNGIARQVAREIAACNTSLSHWDSGVKSIGYWALLGLYWLLDCMSYYAYRSVVQFRGNATCENISSEILINVLTAPKGNATGLGIHGKISQVHVARGFNSHSKKRKNNMIVWSAWS